VVEGRPEVVTDADADRVTAQIEAAEEAAIAREAATANQ